MEYLNENLANGMCIVSILIISFLVYLIIKGKKEQSELGFELERKRINCNNQVVSLQTEIKEHISQITKMRKTISTRNNTIAGIKGELKQTKISLDMCKNKKAITPVEAEKHIKVKEKPKYVNKPKPKKK